MPGDILTQGAAEAITHVAGSAPFTHKMFKATIDGTNWFIKEIPPGKEKRAGKELSPELPAWRECLAQEFFRLIIPHQPVTRFFRDGVTGKYYIRPLRKLSYC